MKDRQSTRNGICTVFGPWSSGVIIGDLVAGVRVLIVDLELGGGNVHTGLAPAEGSLQSIGDRADAGLLHQTKIFHSVISKVKYENRHYVRAARR